MTSVTPSCMEPRAQEKQADLTSSAASELRARGDLANASMADEAVPVPVYTPVSIICHAISAPDPHILSAAFKQTVQKRPLVQEPQALSANAAECHAPLPRFAVWQLRI
mmetsp:Transcript_5548/g.11269  ORF Transcript_5548/g.11269 Transcript_5548/m.11269 type:complete len:109 (+) Transcript_5548:1326-1652(+)